MSKRQGGPMGGGPHGGMGAGEKAKDFKGTIRKLMKYLSEYKIGLIFVLLFAIGSTIFNIAGPKFWEKRQQRFLQDLWEKYPEAPELILKKSHIF